MPDIREEVRASLAVVEKVIARVHARKHDRLIDALAYVDNDGQGDETGRVRWDQIRSLLAALDEAEAKVDTLLSVQRGDEEQLKRVVNQNATLRDALTDEHQGRELDAQSHAKARAEAEREVERLKADMDACDACSGRGTHLVAGEPVPCPDCDGSGWSVVRRLSEEVMRLEASLREVVAADLASRDRCAGYIVEIARLKADLAKHEACLTCGGNGVMDVLKAVYAPDGREEYETTTCAACDGHGKGIVPQLDAEIERLKTDLAEIVRLRARWTALKAWLHTYAHFPDDDIPVRKVQYQIWVLEDSPLDDERRAEFEKMSESASVRRANVTKEDR